MINTSLGPAIVTGAIGLVAAVLSSTVAIVTIRHSKSENVSARRGQLALALMPRRLDSLEIAWRTVFSIEAGEQLAEGDLNNALMSTLWMPDDLRTQFIRILSSPNEPAAINSVRRALINASGGAEIDRAVSELRERGENR